MKLFKITLIGLSSESGIRCNPCYVVAENSHEAYSKVRTYLDEKKYGFSKEREMKSIELIAEDKEYPDCGAMLFIK